MIASLRGVLLAKDERSVTVEVAGGIGFRVFMPASALQRVGEPGAPLDLRTHLHVRENELSLYGFLSEAEQALFELLLTASGIGPKAALALLSRLTVAELSTAIAQEQVEVLSQVPGIGLKTARKLVLELREKVAASAGGVGLSPALAQADAEVLEALTSLGYSVVEAQRALQNVPAETLDLAERLRLALQQLSR
ncbi:MAG: Holliday junction branch migration protein RuvA [Chloroflexi bacterium]|nr:Holliday junction branch migration protein RuvA [Chloroflexota bacterium]